MNTVAAGDTVNIGGGDYNEWVVTVTDGTAGSRIVFRPNATNGTAIQLRQLRVRDPFYYFTGLTVNRTLDIDPSNLNGAHVRIEPAAEQTIITNCVIADTPLLSSRFLFGTNGNELLFTITNRTANFLTNGFVVGGHVFLGASSVSNASETPVLKYYTNHDRAVRIKAISADGQTLTVTNNAGTNFFSDPVQNLWATIFSGLDNGGYPGILLALGSGLHGPTNCLIVGNTISNLAGAAYTTYGESNMFRGNLVTRLNSGYACRPFHRHQTIRDNTFRNSTNRIWLSDYELATASHPLDASFFDYNVGAIHSQVTGTTNILFERNWVENFEQQLGAISQNAVSGVGGFTFRSNVFVGAQSQFSQNSNFLTNSYNTFYRISYEAGHALACGGLSASLLQTNLDLTANAFIDCGQDKDSDTGWYSTQLTQGSNYQNNFACGPEGMGWPAKTSVPSAPIAVNGGDPMLVNILNPIGPDGLPFTADDGLRPLPHSPLATNGIGALTPVPFAVQTPIAHFTQTSQSTWLDYIYTNWNPGWHLIEAPERGGYVRPYNTPDPIGNVPVTVQFSAAASVGGMSGVTNNYGIRYYGWSFGDGGTALTVLPAVAHTYCTTGAMTVVLSITNFYGNWSQSSNVYRILPNTNSLVVRYVATNGLDAAAGTFAAPWLTVQKAANTVNAGDTVAVHPGIYLENVDCTRSASNNFIKFVGLGATVGGWNMRQSKYQIEGFGINFSNIAAANGAIYVYANTTNIVLSNLSIGPSTNTERMAVYFAQGSDGYPETSQQSHTISNSLFYAVDHIQINAMGRGHRFAGNIFRDGNAQCDLFRVWGADSVMADNFGWNICAISENHADIYQIFGQGGTPAFIVASNIVIERNIILNSRMQVCQLENFTNAVLGLTNLIWRNNIINVNAAANIDMDGVKWYNNLFYLTSQGHVMVFGGVKGSAYGSDIKNNLFFECGDDSSDDGIGWYAWMESQSISNYSLTANYNMVVGSNSTAKLAAPPSAGDRWGSTGGVPPNVWEANGINGGNPLFVDAANYDFRPQVGSPLLDGGAAISGFSTDIIGESRPQGAAWAIGPFEGSGESAGVPTIPALIGPGRSSVFISSP